MGFGGGFFRRIAENRERRARGEQPVSAPRPSATPTREASLRSVIEDIISSRQTNDSDIPPNFLPGLGPGQGRGPSVSSAETLQDILFRRALPGANRDPDIDNLISAMQHPEFEGTSQGAEQIRFLQEATTNLPFDEVIRMFQQEQRGEDVESNLLFSKNPALFRDQATTELADLRGLANDPETFASLFDPEVSEQQIESFRQDILNVRNKVITNELIDGIAARMAIESLNEQDPEKLEQIFSNTPTRVVKNISVAQYAASVARDNPNLPINGEEIQKIANMDMDGNPDIVGRETGSGFFGGRTENLVDILDNEELLNLLAERLDVSVESLVAYGQYAEDKGFARDQFGSLSESPNYDNFVESAIKSGLNFSIENPGGGIKTLVDQIAKVQPAFEKQIGRAATSSVGKWVDKNFPGISNPLMQEFDRVPEEYRGQVQSRFVEIFITSPPEEQMAIIDTLEKGPPEKDDFMVQMTGSKDYTDEEKREWVNGVIEQNWNVFDHITAFGSDVIVDPLNLLIFIKPAGAIKGLKNIINIDRTANRAEGLTIPQQIATALRERNLLLLPGGQTLSTVLEPQLKSALLASRSFVPQFNDYYTNITARVSTLSTSGIGKFIPSLLKTKFFTQAKSNQAVRHSLRAANEIDFIKRIAATSDDSVGTFNKIMKEFSDAYAADPENLTQVVKTFEKYGVTPTEYRLLLTKVMGDNKQLLDDVFEEVGNTKNLQKSIEGTHGLMHDAVFRLGYNQLYRAMGGVVDPIDARLLQTQNVMRSALSRIYLATLPFHFRNVLTDSFYIAMEGIGPLRNTKTDLKILKELGFDIAVSGTGPQELTGTAIKMTKLADIANRKTRNPVQFFVDTAKGVADVSTDMEQRTRVRIFSSRAQAWTKAVDDTLLDDLVDCSFCELTQVQQKLTGKASKADATAVADDIVRILQTDVSPGAFEGLIKGIASGRVKTQVRFDRLTGAAIPSNIPKTWMREVKNKLIKMPAGKREGYLLNKIEDLTQDIIKQAGKYDSSPSFETTIRDYIGTFSTEMDIWISKGMKTEDALAVALGSYGEKMRRSVALRQINSAVRARNPQLADRLDEYVRLFEKKVNEVDLELLSKVETTGKEFSKDGFVLRRMKALGEVFDETRGIQRFELIDNEMEDLLGFMGKEIRQGTGKSDVLGADELITGLDDLVQQNGSAIWYLRRINRAEGLNKLVNIHKVEKSNKKTLVDWVKSVRDRRRNLYSSAVGYAQGEADRLILNYLDTGDTDFLLKFVFPWQYWPSRSIPRYMSQIARKPYEAAFFAKSQQEFDQNPVLFRLRNKIRIPFQVAGLGTSYIDPYRLVIPLDFTDAIVFESDMETMVGQTNAALNVQGFGGPLLEAGLAATGLGGSSEFNRSISPPPFEILAATAVLPGLNWLGVTDRRTIRVTPIIRRHIAQQLYAMANDPDQDWTEEQRLEAIREYNRVFGEAKGSFVERLADEFRNPVIENSMLQEAYNKTVNTNVVQNIIRLGTGITNSWLPTGYEEGLKIREDIQAELAEAYRQNDQGNPELLEAIFSDPAKASALLPRPDNITDREARRMLARNEYWNQINAIDDELFTETGGLPIFNTLNKALTQAANDKKDNILASVTEKYNVTEEEVFNARLLAQDLARINLRLVNGEISAEDAVSAFDISFARQFARLTNLEFDNFVDSDGVPDGSLWFKTTQLIRDTIPNMFKEEVDKWKRRDDSEQEALQTAWETLYISPIYDGMAQISSQLDKEVRANAIEHWKDNFVPPSNEAIVDWVLENYPNMDRNQLLKLLEDEVLPNIEQFSLLSTQEDIVNLQKNGVPFRSTNEYLVNESNLEEFRKAHDEFLIWQFARDRNLSTRGLWTDLVEKYFGNGQDTANLVKRQIELQSQIDNKLRNISTEEELQTLLEEDDELRRLIELDNEISEEIIQSNKQDNFRRGRTTSFSTGSSRQNEPASIPAASVSIVLARGEKTWFTEIGNAIREGREISSQVASELFAIFQRHSFGFRSFNSWLLAIYEAWIGAGQPGKEMVTNMLGEKAKLLSPGETTGIVE